jgi:hypothetical protein
MVPAFTSFGICGTLGVLSVRSLVSEAYLGLTELLFLQLKV